MTTDSVKAEHVHSLLVTNEVSRIGKQASSVLNKFDI
jgi:hypothetical protein